MPFLIANLICWLFLLAGAVAVAVALGWPTWAVLLTAFVGFFAFGLLVERLAPGTRFLHWLGWVTRRGA